MIFSTKASFHACLFLLAVTLTGCSTTPAIPDPPAEPIDDNLIVPGSRIGKLALGINEATLLKLMGQPSRSVADSYFYLEPDGKTRYLIGFERGKANRLATSSPHFVTADGIRVGSSELEVRAAWGQPVQELDLHEIGRFAYCFRNGLEVGIDTNSPRRAVAGIEVTPRCRLGTR